MNSDAIMGLHAGGIEFVAAVQPNELAPAIERLTTCHDHVFVVDRSDPEKPQLGVSSRGAQCLSEWFAARTLG